MHPQAAQHEGVPRIVEEIREQGISERIRRPSSA